MRKKLTEKKINCIDVTKRELLNKQYIKQKKIVRQDKKSCEMIFNLREQPKHLCNNKVVKKISWNRKRQ